MALSWAINHIGVSVRRPRRRTGLLVRRSGSSRSRGWTWPVGHGAVRRRPRARRHLRQRGDPGARRSSYLELFAFTSPAPRRATRPRPASPRSPWRSGTSRATVDALARLGHDVVDAETRCPDGTARAARGGQHARDAPRAAPDRPTRRARRCSPWRPTSPSRSTPSPVRPPRPPRACDLGPTTSASTSRASPACRRRAPGDGCAWHHAITSSSGGIASVRYGPTADGVLVELLENRSPEPRCSGRGSRCSADPRRSERRRQGAARARSRAR